MSQIKDNASPGRLGPRSPASSRGHRATLSLNVPVAPVGTQTVIPVSWNGAPPKPARDREGRSHTRSVSIISLGASEGGPNDLASHGSLPERQRGGSRGHGRSASLQIVPRRQGFNGGPTSGKNAESCLIYISDINSTY